MKVAEINERMNGVTDVGGEPNGFLWILIDLNLKSVKDFFLVHRKPSKPVTF